jgi:N-methylhydantoinase A
LLLGRLGAGLLDGRLALDRQRAFDAVRETVGAALGLAEAQAAHAIVRVANANMANATKLISVGRGFDPRDFALVVFGGAGPLHGCDLARELDIPVVIFPRHPGIASAMGCLLVDIRHDLSRMCLFPAEPTSTPRIEALFAELEEEARKRLADDGVAAEAMRLRRTVDMRYAGQWRQLSIEMPPGQGVETALSHFHTEHERAFAFRDEARPVEIYAARVVAEGVVPKPQSAAATARHDAVKLPKPAARRPVYFSERSAYVDTPVYKRETIVAGAQLTGPAVVEQLDSTVVLPPGTLSSVTPDLHIITRLEGDSQ